MYMIVKTEDVNMLMFLWSIWVYEITSTRSHTLPQARIVTLTSLTDPLHTPLLKQYWPSRSLSEITIRAHGWINIILFDDAILR